MTNTAVTGVIIIAPADTTTPIPKLTVTTPVLSFCIFVRLTLTEMELAPVEFEYWELSSLELELLLLSSSSIIESKGSSIPSAFLDMAFLAILPCMSDAMVGLVYCYLLLSSN